MNSSSPKVEFGFRQACPQFQPGETLNCEFQLSDGKHAELAAMETSVLWRTCGKGSEDIGVHFFRRQGRKDLSDLSQDSVHRFSTVIPKSPLSYQGAIVSIEWLVRVKLFFKRGKQAVFDYPLRIGSARSHLQLKAAEAAKAAVAAVSSTELGESTGEAEG